MVGVACPGTMVGVACPGTYSVYEAQGGVYAAQGGREGIPRVCKTTYPGWSRMCRTVVYPIVGYSHRCDRSNSAQRDIPTITPLRSLSADMPPTHGLLPC